MNDEFEKNSFCRNKINLIIDFYELTMANGYLINNCANVIAVFDVFF